MLLSISWIETLLNVEWSHWCYLSVFISFPLWLSISLIISSIHWLSFSFIDGLWLSFLKWIFELFTWWLTRRNCVYSCNVSLFLSNSLTNDFRNNSLFDFYFFFFWVILWLIEKIFHSLIKSPGYSWLIDFQWWHSIFQFLNFVLFNKCQDPPALLT